MFEFINRYFTRILSNSETVEDLLNSKMQKLRIDETQKEQKKYRVTPKVPRKFHRANVSSHSNNVRRLKRYSSNELSLQKLKKRQKVKSFYVWNRFVESLNKSIKNEQHQTPNWSVQEIGIKSSVNNNIQLIKSFNDFNQQLFVESNGQKLQANDFFNSDNPITDNSFEIRYKLVPIIDGFSVTQNGTKNYYTFCNDSGVFERSQSIDKNNNKFAYECRYENHMRFKEMPIMNDSIMFKTSSSVDDVKNEKYSSDSGDLTVLNVFDEYSNPIEWSYFVSNLPPTASSSLITERKENAPCEVYRSKTQTPKKLAKPNREVYVDSPMPANHVFYSNNHQIQHLIEIWTDTISLNRQINENLEELCEKFNGATNLHRRHDGSNDSRYNKVVPKRSKRNTFSITGPEPMFELELT